MNRRASAFVWAAGLALLVWLFAPSGQAIEAPGAGVDEFHALLVKVMQISRFEDREAKLVPAVENFFHLEAIARISLGASWRQLEPPRRTAFMQLLERRIVSTYAERFDSYSGQKFERLELVQASTGPVVKSRLIRANKEDVNLDYYFRDGKVFNLVADGVSDLSLRRAEYAGIIRKQGYDALVSHIEAGLAEVMAGEE